MQRNFKNMMPRPQQAMAPAKANVTVTNDRERGIFAKVKQKWEQEGRIATPGFLRIEQQIVNGKGRYQFAVTKDSNSDTVTEAKLDRNDKFLITHLGLFLMRRETALPGIEVLQTYPNPVVFDYSTSSYAAHMEALYNGFLSIQVGQTVFIEKMDTRRFRVVPVTQKAAFAAVDGTDGAGAASTLAIASSMLIANSSANGFDGFIELTPQFEVDGDGKTALVIEAPVHSNAKVAATESGYTYQMVLMARGFLGTRR